MKQPRFHCGDRDPKCLGSLIHRAFLQLMKFDDVSKPRTQLCNRLSQGRLAFFFRANPFWIWREIPEFMVEINTDRAFRFRFLAEFAGLDDSSRTFNPTASAHAFLELFSQIDRIRSCSRSRQVAAGDSPTNPLPRAIAQQREAPSKRQCQCSKTAALCLRSYVPQQRPKVCVLNVDMKTVHAAPPNKIRKQSNGNRCKVASARITPANSTVAPETTQSTDNLLRARCSTTAPITAPTPKNPSSNP